MSWLTIWKDSKKPHNRWNISNFTCIVFHKISLTEMKNNLKVKFVPCKKWQIEKSNVKDFKLVHLSFWDSSILDKVDPYLAKKWPDIKVSTHNSFVFVLKITQPPLKPDIAYWAFVLF